MSKRSGMSRWEDLKRWFVDVGRYRYILHKFDMETWRNAPCPQCGVAFTEEPRYYFNGQGLHWDCGEPYIDKWYEEEAEAIDSSLITPLDDEDGSP